MNARKVLSSKRDYKHKTACKKSTILPFFKLWDFYASAMRYFIRATGSVNNINE